MARMSGAQKRHGAASVLPSQRSNAQQKLRKPIVIMVKCAACKAKAFERYGGHLCERDEQNNGKHVDCMATATFRKWFMLRVLTCFLFVLCRSWTMNWRGYTPGRNCAYKVLAGRRADAFSSCLGEWKITNRRSVYLEDIQPSVTSLSCLRHSVLPAYRVQTGAEPLTRSISQVKLFIFANFWCVDWERSIKGGH